MRLYPNRRAKGRDLRESSASIAKPASVTGINLMHYAYRRERREVPRDGDPEKAAGGGGKKGKHQNQKAKGTELNKVAVFPARDRGQ
jgi:hypothetical protein